MVGEADGSWSRGSSLVLDPPVGRGGLTGRPVTIRIQADGRIVVGVHQVIRNLSGEVLDEGRVLHIYELRDGLVARMDIDERASID